MSVTAAQHLEKQPSEVRTYTMNFGNLMATGETISTIASVTSELRGGGSSNLVLASETISGQTVTLVISGGTHGRTYRVEIKITTSNGQTLEGDGILKVLDK